MKTVWLGLARSPFFGRSFIQRPSELSSQAVALSASSTSNARTRSCCARESSTGATSSMR